MKTTFGAALAGAILCGSACLAEPSLAAQTKATDSGGGAAAATSTFGTGQIAQNDTAKAKVTHRRTAKTRASVRHASTNGGAQSEESRTRELNRESLQSAEGGSAPIATR